MEMIIAAADEQQLCNGAVSVSGSRSIAHCDTARRRMPFDARQISRTNGVGRQNAEKIFDLRMLVNCSEPS